MTILWVDYTASTVAVRYESWYRLLGDTVPDTNPRKGRPWTPADLQMLKAAAAAGQTITELAVLLDRSPWAIRTKAAHERVTMVNKVRVRGPRRPLPWETDQP